MDTQKNELLRNKAYALRLDHKKIADDIGYSRTWVSLYMNGKVGGDPPVERAIEKYLDKIEAEREEEPEAVFA